MDTRSSISGLLSRVGALHLFRSVLDDEIGRAYLTIGRALVDDGPGTAISEAYARLFSLLAAEVELRTTPLTGDPWQSHVVDRLLLDENPLSLKAQRVPLEAMGGSLLRAARRDLAALHELFLLDANALFEMLRERVGGDAGYLIPWTDLLPEASASGRADLPPIRERLASEPDWPGLLPELVRHYASFGCGDFARFDAFRWVHRDGESRLDGVAYPDLTRLEELVEYDAERALLLQNTEQFVAGFPANNVLLYGERGTGKSSTVKALLNRYGAQGLRLVEVPKSLLGEFPQILAHLRGRRERFVLFVDDLSFDERETSYKELKAALEGNVEARPDNVVVYATSNRRHMVQERFSDRGAGDSEIRGWDTHEEKLSLADRFGITLVFTSPDQDRYLRIVESLVAQRGLGVDGDNLRFRARQWATEQGGFSGRTARQFVDHLAGELGLAGTLADGVA